MRRVSHIKIEICTRLFEKKERNTYNSIINITMEQFLILYYTYQTSNYISNAQKETL